ncbi:MAG: deoxyhypusine synthase [Thaumarchaeota archaeon]|nr:MAG: deoxyhypusine synthase [Nitrososphaerota archaeon]
MTDSVRDYEIQSKSISLLLDGMANSGGFESKNLWNGINIIRTMTKDANCTRFLSFVGSIISTGARGIIKDMLKRKMFDCVITTCGALDHDIARTSTKYYSGDFRMDDNMLYKKNIHRLGNVLVPQNNYGPVIEEKVQNCLNGLYQKGSHSVSTFEITRHIGSTLDESSFLYWASKNDIPVIVPGIVDGAVGSQIWFFYQKHKDFSVNILLDETKLSDLVYEANKTGAFIIGGGISKHHTLWWNQFRGGLDYAVSITTSSEWDGSLSGALVAEAISWGKVKANAKQTTIHAEATTLLPLIYAALLDK